MVAIFTGLGAGFERGSGSVLGGAGLLGSGSLGRNKEQVLLNAANGNLMISQQDEFLVGLGPDSAIGRAYNSIEDVPDGDNGDHWRQSTTRAVHGLTGTLNAAGSTIKRTSGDGSDITYTYQTINGVTAYFSPEGFGAYDKLVNASGVWTWTDGDTQSTETYGTDGRITQMANVLGLKLNFTYTGANLTQVTTQDGSYEQYSWSGGNITQIITGYIDLQYSTAKTLTRTRYGYDTSNRLTTVTIDLTPEDNVANDGATYVTTYTYDGTSKRVASISETDGSSLAIHYDSSGRVDTLTQTVASGVAPRVTTIAYTTGATTGTTTITDPLLQATTLEYNLADGSLKTVTSPPAYSGATAQVTRFDYTTDGKGNLRTVIDPLGTVNTYAYDNSGNAVSVTETDSLNNVIKTVTRTYGSLNEMLTETRTGSDAGSAGASHTTRYLYGGVGNDNLLIAKIDAEGRITVYLYQSGQGLVSQEKQYNDAFYDVSALNPTDLVTYSQLSSFLASMATKANTVNTTYTRDARGQILSIRTTSSANASAGGGDTAQPYAVTNYVYDQAGQLLKRTATGFNTETFVYDGMGRIKLSTDLNGGTTTIAFNDSTMQTVVTLASGLIQTSVYNKAGELVSFNESSSSGSNVNGGTATYTYDQIGRLRTAQDATLRNHYSVYDAVGRKVGESDDYGNLVEYRYDADDRLVATIRYTNRLSATNLASVQNPLSAIAMAGIRPTANAADIWTWKIYDADGRVIEAINGDGGVTTYQYDASSRLIRTIVYANKLAPALLDINQTGNIKTTLPTAAIVPTGDSAHDSIARNFYDKTGLLIGMLNGEGFLSRVAYDNVGRKVTEIAYATITDSSLRASGTFNALVTSVTTVPNPADRTTRYVYDGQSHLRFQIDALNHVTEYIYDSGTAGQASVLRETIQYAGTISALSDYKLATVKTAVAALASNTDNRKSWAVYDTAGRLTFSIDAMGAVTRFVYDTMGWVTRTVQLSTLRATTTLPTYDDMTNWADANGTGTDRIARNYYTARGEVRYSVDAEGYVTWHDYDAEGREITTRRWDTPITTTNATTIGDVQTLATGAYATVSTTYDLDGNVYSVSDDLGNRHTYFYNANGTLGLDITAYLSPDESRKAFVYDAAGRVIGEYDAHGSTEQTLVAQYGYDGLGNLTIAIDANNNASFSYYDRLGRVVSTRDAENYVTETTYNAFNEAVSVTRRSNRATNAASASALPVYTVDAAHDATSYTYYNILGQVTATRDAEDYVTEYSYTTFGEISSTTRRANKATNTAGTTTLPTYTADAVNDATSFSYYNRRGQVTTSRDAENYVTETAYNAAGDAVSITRRANKATNTASASTLPTYTADAVNDATSYNYYNRRSQVTTTRDAEDYVTETSYNARGEVIAFTRRANKASNSANALTLPTYTPDTARDQTSYLYRDHLGRVTTTRDAEGYVVETAYNAAGAVVSVVRRANAATNTASTTVLPTYTADVAKDATNYNYYDKLGRLTTTRDAESDVTEIVYDALGNIVSATQRANKATNTASAATLPTYAVDAVNDATSYNYYDRLGRLTTSRDAESYVIETAYDSAGNVVSVVRRANKATNTASAAALPVYTADSANDAASYRYYDRRNLLTTNRDAENYVTEMAYDARGNTVSVTKRFNKATNTANAATLPTYTIDSANDSTTYNYYDRRDLLTTSRDAESFVTEMAYNVFGEMVSMTRRANAATNTASATTLPTYIADGAKDSSTYTYYDRLGRVTTTRDAENDVTEMAYNALGKVVSVTRRGNKATNTASATTLPVYTTDALKDAVSYSYYDRLGRLVSSRDAMSFVVETAYDALGNVVSVMRRWNAATNTASATILPNYTADSAKDAASYTYYDRLGRAIAARDAESYVTEIAYDTRGNMVSVTRRANKATNTASAATLPVYTADAAHDITTSSYYDMRNLLTARRDAASFVTEMTYNARGDVVLTTRRANAASNTASATVLPVYTADAARDASSYFYYDRLGQLTATRDDESWVTENSYNAFGQLSATTRRANKATNTASIAVLPTYVADSAHDTTTSYEYYRTGRLKKTIEAEIDPTVAGGTTHYFEQYTYDALGDRLSVRDAVGAVTSFEYDRLGRVGKSIDAEIDSTVAGGTTHYFEQYTYDALGNRKTVRNKLGGTTTYYYDFDGRMSSEELPISAVASDGTVVATIVTNTYGYDARGNLKQKIEAAGLAEARVTTYYYNRLDRLTETDHTVENNINTATVGTHEYINYDANGNVVEKIDQLSARTLFYYDTLNRVTVQISATGTYTTFAYTNDTGVGSTQTVKVYATQFTTAQLAAISSPPTTTPPTAPSGAYRETISKYDKLGQLSSTIVNNVRTGSWISGVYVTSGTTTVTTGYQYDAAGNVIAATDGNLGVTYTYYDRMGRKAAQVDQNKYLTTWQLDGNGNVLTEVRAFNVATGVSTTGYTAGAANTADRITKFTYDKDGRRLTEQRINLNYYTIDANSGTLNLVPGADGTGNDVGTSKIVYAYNGLGEVLSKTEATGDAHTYNYDSAGRLINEARASYSDYTSTPSTTVTDTPTIRYFYNGLGDLTRTQQGGAIANNSTDRITKYSYLAGRQTSMIDAAGNVHEYYYDTVGRKYGEAYYRVESDGTTMLHEGIAYRYDLDGNLVRQAFSTVSNSGIFTDAGDVTTLAYNAYGELTSRSLMGAGSSTSVVQEQYAYDNAGHMWASNSGDGVWRYFVYDANGNQTLKLEDEGKAGVNLVNRATIDDVLTIATVNSMATVGATYIDGITATVTIYDARNQQTSVSQKKRQLSAAATTTAATADLTTSRTYNAFGEAITETDARGYTTTNYYNVMGRTTSVQHNAVSFENTNLTITSITPAETYFYDRSGRLIGQEDANGNRITQLLLAGTSYGDATAMVVKEFHPDSGILSNGYDVYGDMRDAANALNYHTANAYDALGRLIQVTHPTAPAGTLIDYYVYDVLGQRIQAWNNQLLKPVYGPPETQWYENLEEPGGGHYETHLTLLGYVPDKQLTDYDVQGRVVSQVAIGGERMVVVDEPPISGDTTTMTYSWSAAAATTGLGTFGAYSRTTTYANGKTLIEVFDGFGHAISKKDLGDHVTTYGYDTAGRTVSRTLSGLGTSALDNGTYTYLNTGLISTAASGTVGSPASGDTLATYTYDAVGNKLTENTVRTLYPGSNDTIQNATATYDELGRIKHWTEAGNATTPYADITWTYDKAGNVRHEKATYHALDLSTGVASSTLSTQDYWYAYDTQNHVTISKGVVSSGGAIERGTQGTEIQYDAAGQRKRVFTTAFATGSIIDPYSSQQNPSWFDITFRQDRMEEYTYSANGTLASVSIAKSGYEDHGDGGYELTGLPATGEVKSTFTYDLMGRMKRQQDWTGNGTGVALDRQLLYNNNGQLFSDTTVSLQGSDTWTTYIYTYFGAGTSSYALGAAVSIMTNSSKNGGTSTVSQNVIDYDWYDGAVQLKNTYKPDYYQSATTATDYTNSGTGTLLAASVGGAGGYYVTVINDAQGQGIRRDVSSSNGANPHEIWYRFNGKQLGYVGNNGTTNTDYQSSIDMRTTPVVTGTPGPFRGGGFAGSSYADFDQNYDAINSYSQGSDRGTYTVQSGDTLSSIAARLWGDSSLWYKLAEANGIGAGASLVSGQTLIVPAGVTKSSNSASTFRPYNASDAYGDTSPTAPAPPPAKKGCGILGQIFLLIIAVAVTIWASPAGSVGIWQAVLAAGAGSLASQGVGLITGIQKKFDFKGLALSVISAGVTAGIGQLANVGKAAQAAGKAISGLTKTVQNVGTFLTKGGFISNVARGALGSAITQGIGVATGLQEKFSWTGVAAAGLGAGVGAAAGKWAKSTFHLNTTLNAQGGYNNLLDAAVYRGVSGAAAGLASAATRSVIDGTDFGDNVIAALPDAIASTIGGLVGDAINKKAASSAERRMAAKADEQRRQEADLAAQVTSVAQQIGSSGGSSVTIGGDKYVLTQMGQVFKADSTINGSDAATHPVLADGTLGAASDVRSGKFIYVAVGKENAPNAYESELTKNGEPYARVFGSEAGGYDLATVSISASAFKIGTSIYAQYFTEAQLQAQAAARQAPAAPAAPKGQSLSEGFWEEAGNSSLGKGLELLGVYGAKYGLKYGLRITTTVFDKRQDILEAGARRHLVSSGNTLLHVATDVGTLANTATHPWLLLDPNVRAQTMGAGQRMIGRGTKLVVGAGTAAKNLMLDGARVIDYATLGINPGEAGHSLFRLTETAAVGLATEGLGMGLNAARVAVLGDGAAALSRLETVGADTLEFERGFGGTAGHNLAESVVPGGSGRAFAGHGVMNGMDTLIGEGTFVAPQGTTVIMPRSGITIADSTGRLLENMNSIEDLQNTLRTGIDLNGDILTPRNMRDLQGYQVIRPGQTGPNLTLLDPGFQGQGLNIMERSSTTLAPSRLSELLDPNMGCTFWAACTQPVPYIPGR